MEAWIRIAIFLQKLDTKRNSHANCMTETPNLRFITGSRGAARSEVRRPSRDIGRNSNVNKCGDKEIGIVQACSDEQ